LASHLAAQTVFERMVADWVPDRRVDPRSFDAFLTDAIQAANRAVHQRSKEDPGLEGMGTTMTAAGILGDQITFAQVGDSRAYLIRDGRAEQMTEDQSLMQRLVDEGQITEEDAQNSPGRNIILQALGPTPEVEVVLTHQKARRGDAVVLCSDGLSGVVQAQEILEAVDRSQDPAVVCEDLVELANSRGGPDNITVIVARLDGPGLKEPGGRG
jgi:protein phosphatase